MDNTTMNPGYSKLIGRVGLTAGMLSGGVADGHWS